MQFTIRFVIALTITAGLLLQISNLRSEIRKTEEKTAELRGTIQANSASVQKAREETVIIQRGLKSIQQNDAAIDQSIKSFEKIQEAYGKLNVDPDGGLQAVQVPTVSTDQSFSYRCNLYVPAGDRVRLRCEIVQRGSKTLLQESLFEPRGVFEKFLDTGLSTIDVTMAVENKKHVVKIKVNDDVFHQLVFAGKYTRVSSRTYSVRETANRRRPTHTLLNLTPSNRSKDTLSVRLFRTDAAGDQ